MKHLSYSTYLSIFIFICLTSTQIFTNRFLFFRTSLAHFKFNNNFLVCFTGPTHTFTPILFFGSFLTQKPFDLIYLKYFIFFSC